MKALLTTRPSESPGGIQTQRRKASGFSAKVRSVKKVWRRSCDGQVATPSVSGVKSGERLSFPVKARLVK